jgi:hypothetical protein
MSSIFRIMRTVSVASAMALVETSSGCSTFSSRMSEMMLLRTLMPAVLLPSACCLRSSVTMAIGFMPAFSASV